MPAGSEVSNYRYQLNEDGLIAVATELKSYVEIFGMGFELEKNLDDDLNDRLTRFGEYLTKVRHDEKDANVGQTVGFGAKLERDLSRAFNARFSRDLGEFTSGCTKYLRECPDVFMQFRARWEESLITLTGVLNSNAKMVEKAKSCVVTSDALTAISDEITRIRDEKRRQRFHAKLDELIPVFMEQAA